jgi:PPK2 family polyphosphate:nucleotide phosphotransferase
MAANMQLTDVVKRLRVDKGDKFRLADRDPGDAFGLDKADAKTMLGELVERLSVLQEKLYAHDRWAILVILQGMDTAGKDGIIEHVMSGINPQGCQVFSFKAPSAQELEHDFMWRHVLCLPERGRIGVFNRSYYEEVLVVRVHPEILARQKLPLVAKDIWQQRFEDINAFERYLARNGTLILKFFLHISKEEQRDRLLARLDDPDKHWKFELGDLAERKLWDEYMHAYEDMIRQTSRPEAPWYVVPADRKWLGRVLVAAAMVDALERLDLSVPKLDAEATKQLKVAREQLLAEGPRKGTKRA